MRKLVLLAVTAVAALAFAAPANATHVEVEDRASSNMCSDTGAGHCTIHIVSTGADLIVHTFLGEISYDCNVEIDANVESNGVGTTTGVDIRDGGSSNCNEDLIPCDLPWTATARHNGSGTEFLDNDLCINPPIIDTCEGTLTEDLIKSGNNYSAELNDVEITGDPNCEFDGDYTLEDPDGVEIHHLAG